MHRGMTSKTILLAAWGPVGELYPVLGLARELQRRGHRAALATPACHAEAVAALDLPWQRLRPDMAAAPPDLRQSFDDLRQAVAALGGVDLIVAHPRVPAAGVLAEALSLRCLSLLLRPPPPGPRGRTSWWAPRRMFAWLRRPPRDPVAELRAELDLPPSVPPAAGVVALFPETFRLPGAQLPPGTIAAGFVFYDGAAHQPAPVELTDFLDSGAAPVVFTLGVEAARAAGDFFRVGIAAAERLGRRAVVLVGDRATLGTPPSAGTAVVAYAPHGMLLPRAAAVVHHGGIGTAAQALRAGKPQLIVPFGGDQGDIARLCRSHGVAEVLERRHYRVGTVARALSRLLADEATARRAAVLSRELARDGARRAADAVETVLYGRPAGANIAYLSPRMHG